MAHHKRHRPKSRRGGCLLCKMHKLPANKHGEKAKAKRAALAFERSVG